MIDGWEIVFNSLWQQTQDEIVETRLNQAKIDEIYVTKLGMNSKIVIQNRFGGKDYSYETSMDVEVEEVDGDVETEEDMDNEVIETETEEQEDE